MTSPLRTPRVPTNGASSLLYGRPRLRHVTLQENTPTKIYNDRGFHHFRFWLALPRKSTMTELLSLKEILHENTRPAASELVVREDANIRCLACGHRCLIPETRSGICKVRTNRDGELRVPWGYVAALQW